MAGRRALRIEARPVIDDFEPGRPDPAGRKEIETFFAPACLRMFSIAS